MIVRVLTIRLNGGWQRFSGARDELKEALPLDFPSGSTSDDDIPAGFQNSEIPGRDSHGRERRGQRLRWIAATLIGQLKGAPVHGEALASAKIAVDLHGLGRVAVLASHKPTRFIRTDWHEGEVGGAEAFADFGKQCGLVAGIAYEIEASVGRADIETAPQAAATSPAQPFAPMLSGRDRDVKVWRRLMVLPPIELDDSGESGPIEQVAIAEWSDGKWIVSFDQPPEGGQIAMVIMVVA